MGVGVLNRNNLDITQLLVINDWAEKEAKRRGISPATANIQARSGKMDAGTVYVGKDRSGQCTWFIHKGAIYKPQRGPNPRPHHEPEKINVVAASTFDDMRGSRGAAIREWVKSKSGIPYVESNSGWVYVWEDEDISVEKVLADRRKGSTSAVKAQEVIASGAVDGTRWQVPIQCLADGGTLEDAGVIAGVTRERVRQVLNQALRLATIGKTWQKEKRSSQMKRNRILVPTRNPSEITPASQFKRGAVSGGQSRKTTPLGNLLRSTRLEFDLSLSDVSEATGINPTVINTAELGKTMLTAKNLFLLAHFYEIPLEKFKEAIFGEGES